MTYLVRARHTRTGKHLYLQDPGPPDHWHYRKSSAHLFQDRAEAEQVLQDPDLGSGLVTHIGIVPGGSSKAL